jgi:RimJ/RimL family protein N-acetyltransferase
MTRADEPQFAAKQHDDVPVPVLHRGDLTLRGWQLDDGHVDAVLYAARDPLIRDYSSVGRVRDRAQARAWITSRMTPPRIDWVVRESDLIVGRIGLHRIQLDEGVGELGYWLLPEARGRGVATSAVQTVESWAFGDLGLGRLEIRHEPANERSCALALRCGYPAEGTQRGVFPPQDAKDGVRLDLHLHARLATDPLPG